MSRPKPEKTKDKYIDRSQILLEERKAGSKSCNLSNQTKLAEIEEKFKMFGGLEEMEEEFLKDLGHNNQRLD